MTEASDGGGAAGVSTQLAMLVPAFDPAVDNVDIWSTKVSLLLETWPSSKITELATRLVLNTKGTAFQKLQLHQKEILVNDVSGIKRIVELVGGTWGQVPLEHRFELLEKGLYRCVQKSDETSDSYVARVDVIWTELILKQVDLEEVKAYVLLRGSKLGPEDRKRVLVESGAESIHEKKKLEWAKVVSAIRMLGSSFFQDYTGARRDKSLKTYDHLAFNMEEVNEEMGQEHETYWAQDEVLDDDTIASMAQDQDEDAALIVQFEDAVTETMQSDPDLAAFFSTYQDARRRLTERVKFRGFWPVRKGGKGGGKPKGKGKGKGGKMSLAQKIANSYCKICWQKGHWKAECPSRKQGESPTSGASTAPTSFVTTTTVLPELISLPEMPNPEPRNDQVPVVEIFGVSCFSTPKKT